MRSRRATRAALPVIVLLSACGLLSPPPGGGPIAHPDGTNVVVRIEWTGGFVPYEYLFTSLPRFTLLGDGRVLVEGPQIEIYPGPALPNVQVRRLTEEGVQSVLFRVFETGQFDANHSWTGASQFIADANSTVFTIHADGREVVVDVYALGLAADLGGGIPEAISPAEREAHRALGALEADLLNLDGWIAADDWADPAWQAYEPEALRLLVTDVTDTPPVDPGLTPEPLPWPGRTPPTTIGDPSDVQDFRCGVVAGDEGATWLAALSSATELTRWSYEGRLYRVSPRPLLPGEGLDCGLTEG